MASPYTASSSPGYHSPNMQKHPLQPPLKKYSLQPPHKQLPLSKTMPAMGYPGMFPQRPSQDEDILTESNVRNGFIDRPVVSNEHTCAHDIVYGKLQDDQRLLGELGNFMVDVLKRKKTAERITGPASFKPPIRSTLIDSKKEQWMQELAAGVVSLRKLARNVPHGFKGEKLLETLAARQVPFLRATWYIKVVGLSEMSQRNASNSSNSTSQSLQWTYIVTDHLKKQLAELANINASAPPARGYKGHPSTPNQHDSAPKPWATAESRARFEQRWAYSTRLTQWQYVEGLLEQRNFLRWTLDALRNSSTFEIMWLILTGIVQDYVDEYRRNRTLMKLLIDTLIKAYSALMQIQDHEQVWAYQGLRKDIEHMLQSLFLSTPDMFVVPMLYHQYRHLFDMILGEKPQQSKALPNISRVMSEYWTLVKARNEVFCGTAEQNAPASASTQAVISSVERNPLVPSVVEKPRDTIEEEQVVQILDELGRTIASGSGLLIHGDGWINTEGRTATSAAEAIFDDGHLSKPSVFQIVHIMCRWATSDYGIKADQSIIFLFDTLIRLQLFSYQKYLLRLIARGDLEVKHRQESRVLRCIYYLSAFPLPSNAPPFLVNQRRVAISNHRSDDTTHQESQDLDRLKYLAKLAILGSEDGSPCLFGQGAKDLTQQTPNDDRSSYHLAITDTIEQELHLALDRASRYTILHFTSEWLVQEVKRFVVKNVQIGEDNWRVMTSPGSCLLNARQYVMVIKILEYAKDYLSLVDVALWVLEKTNERDLYLYIIDTLRRHANIWKLVDKTGNRIAETFLAKHNSLQNRGNRERSLMMYIVQLVQEGYQMKSDMHAQFQQDLQAKPRVGYVGSSMSLLEDLTLLASNPTNASARTLAESLYSRYHSTAGSIQSILETSITAIRHAIRVKDDPTLAPMQFELYSILAAFADLFRQLGEQATITGQLDMVIVSWLTQQDLSNTDMPSAFMEEMNQPHSWIPLFITLLIARGAVNLDTIFRNNVLPWFGQIGGAIQQQTEPDLSVDVTENRLLQFCKNLVVLVRLLIVQDHCHLATENGADSTAVTWDLRVEDIFHLEAQRLSQLSSSLNKIEPMFRLMEHLLIIATNLPLSSSLLQDLVMLRAALLQIGWFRQACIRDLHGVYQRFAANEAEAATEKKIKKKMLCIVDELIGGNLCETRSSMVSEAAPDFIDKLQRVFTNMNQWNEEQCRVQVNLLLDNIMLSEGNMLNHNNPHILGDDATADLSLTSNVLPSTSEMPSSNKDLDSFVQFFYDMVLSPPKDDEQPSGAQRRATFFKNLIHGVRESVLLELLKYAMRLLEGDPDMPFPGNMLLLQTSDAATTNNGTDVVWDSEQYAHKNQTFLTIVQHMTAENVWTTEKKIEMVKMLYKQIKQFKNAIPTYKVMQGAHATYADAVRALQLVKNDVNLAIVLLVTDGLPDYQPSESIEEKVTLQDIRTSLLIRLRLMVPFVSLIWEHPLKTECDILEWIQVLVPLLVNPVVHGNGKQERFFEFVLDFVSLLIDEVPKDLRKANLNQLSSMQTELSSVPAIFHSRLKRILPFLTHNIYLTSTRIGSALLGLSPAVDPQQQQQHLEACLDQSKPWEWLEDYMSDPPHDNDVPVNLAIFNARKSKRADGTYIRWFKHGFDEGFASDNSEASWRVCAMGKYRPQSNRPTDDNGFNFIVTDDEEMPDHHGSSASTPRKRPLDMEEGELLQ
ncbi:uncharacterized protein BYT42DRAFT_501141 [Radiomyces spectabilis]|uniref:uncharacterized protein n=1 Tax=Radiomyces spectabilis TaxID=64574 RepID=UPI00221F9192|nr:uncharacterized protein BYT42DRAFT_501141 [Radiomyces spectabilis]KAI8372975.1 hypothetical protein BYT42DRAFT_501141 [Radiomyces spectabilis]